MEKTYLRGKINYAKIESSRMSALHIRAHNIIHLYMYTYIQSVTDRTAFWNKFFSK